MPALDRALPRGGGRQAPGVHGLGLLGQAGSLVRRPEREAADHRPGAGRAWRDFLFKVLYETGYASQPSGSSREDGLTLRNAYITAAARCAPPGNKPTPQEMRNCRPYLERELELLSNVRVVVALGKIAFDVYLSILRDRGQIASRSAFVFGHNVAHETGPGQPLLIGSYHPSQQNTSTGRLFERAKSVCTSKTQEEIS